MHKSSESTGSSPTLVAVLAESLVSPCSPAAPIQPHRAAGAHGPGMFAALLGFFHLPPGQKPKTNASLWIFVTIVMLRGLFPSASALGFVFVLRLSCLK